MKTIATLFVTVLIGLSVARADSILLSDNFDGVSLDPAKWTTILPFGSSSVIQSGGSVTTMGRGILGTVDGFSGPYVLSGGFTLLNDFEHFNVVLRTDLSATDSFAERTGLIVTFVNDGNGISIQQYTNPMINWTQPASTGQNGFILETGQFYTFSITDTGTAVSVDVNGVPVLSADTTYSTGNQIGFYSREFGFTGTRIDGITVTSTVPDTGSTVFFLGLGLLGLVVARRFPMNWTQWKPSSPS